VIRPATPTLAEIAANEALIEALDAPLAAALCAQASALAGRLAVRIVLALAHESPAPDQALSAKQAAERLGKAPTTLYRLARNEPYRSLLLPTGNRTVRFSSRRVMEYLSGTNRPGPNQGTPAPLDRRMGPRPARPPMVIPNGRGGG
jgi:hypothetical protein